MDQKWRKLNVLGTLYILLSYILFLYSYNHNNFNKTFLATGQVVNMVRESMSRRQQPNNTTTGMTHIRIPASYQAGITLVMCADSAAATELLHAEQLPLL